MEEGIEIQPAHFNQIFIYESICNIVGCVQISQGIYKYALCCPELLTVQKSNEQPKNTDGY